jgi:geranylgeranyl diphosphate synthase, type II
MTSLPAFFTSCQDTVNGALDRFVPADASTAPVRAIPPALLDAMRYTLLAPSKRVRAVLVLLAADLCGDDRRALPAACAIEAVHASSLMLDDLPSMDNAPLRRGRPTSHRTFGEAVTILAAFGLLNEAFGHIAREYEPALASRLVSLLADAVGLDGLVTGQAEDVLATDATISFETLERIHRRKTGVLFSASATAGALTAGGTDADVAVLTAYAKNLGLAFQVIDDLLDVTGTPEETGKATRHDARKTTFVSFSGVDGARALAGELCRTACTALEPFGRRAARLRELADFVASRRL